MKVEIQRNITNDSFISVKKIHDVLSHYLRSKLRLIYEFNNLIGKSARLLEPGERKPFFNLFMY